MPMPNFPDFGPLRESSWPHAPRNAGFHRICRPLPSTVFGKIPRWRLMTTSPVLGQNPRPEPAPLKGTFAAIRVVPWLIRRNPVEEPAQDDLDRETFEHVLNLPHPVVEDLT